MANETSDKDGKTMPDVEVKNEAKTEAAVETKANDKVEAKDTNSEKTVKETSSATETKADTKTETSKSSNKDAASENTKKKSSGGSKYGKSSSRNDREDKGNNASGDSVLVDKLVAINRVAKVVKGGKRFGFAALVVVGDGNGRVGFGKGKAREVPEAIRKATNNANTKMVKVPLREGRTLHHDIIGRFGAGKVVMRSAPPGTGIIAGGPTRAVFETLGIHDVVVKSVGCSNPYNMVRAVFAGLQKCQSPRMVALRRSLKTSSISERRAQGK